MLLKVLGTTLYTFIIIMWVVFLIGVLQGEVLDTTQIVLACSNSIALFLILTLHLWLRE